ncbi:Hypothetical predicted protein [Mytilus galloprovincialis]|uniref:Uncharacterized protein n=1 Tax=Mytilus galloprovincialis TaxID=29158 RepID=A0A8B6GMC0_MYTGA|nr:Hypothetical predicted protein [Mytilus galloprovincialis]
MIPHKKALVLQELTPETDLHYINFEYRTRKLMVLLFMREKDPYNALGSKLWYVKWLIGQEEYSQYEEGMVKDLNFIISMIKEMKTRKDYYNMSKTCTILLHVLNSDTSWHQLGDLWKQEELTCLLSDLLSLLPEELFHEVFEVSLEKAEMMNSSERFFSIKTYTYIDLLFKLLWCGKKINEGHADSNIVIECLNYYYMENCQGSIVEFTAQILNIICCLPENSFIKVILQGFLRKNLKTVTSMAILTPGYDRSGQIVNLNSTAEKSKKGLIYTQCASILSGNKMTNVDIKQYARKLNIKGPEDENEVETVSGQVKLLVLCILLLLVTALGNKSAKLKKYLALKYEYVMASLYLLWCSGDIEVHPGPPWRTKQLKHNSERKRKWLQDINSIFLKLYLDKPTHSKLKTSWQKDNQPKEWPLDEPFYDTKNASKVAKGKKITDGKILTYLLECLKKKEINIPQIYQSELSAWTNEKIQLLHKLQVYRIEMEKIMSALLNLILSNLEDDAKSLQNINVSLKNSTLNKMQIEGLLNNDRRQKKQAEMVAEITRDLASILCRQARGTDQKNKGDGIWDLPPPVNWPDAVSFFDPKNRGKNKDKSKCSDKVLVFTFLNLPDLEIPQNLEQIVDAYKTMYNSTNTEEKKRNKDELCRLYSIQSNLANLDCSLHNLYTECFFSREVHAIFNQWWKTQSVDEHAENVLKNTIVRSDERPHITIDITKGYEPNADLKYISYTFPIKDVYLHIQCTTDHPDQSSQGQTITGSLITVKSPENIEESDIPPDVINFVLEHDLVNQTKCPNDNSVTDNRFMPFDLQRQGTPLPIRHQHLTPYYDLDTLTTHNTLASDLNGSRRTTEYVTSVQACNSEYNSSGSTGENLGGNMGTSTVKAIIKRKQIEDSEEPVKKLLKTKVNQFGHYNRTDGEISSSESKNDGGSQEPNHISTSNQHDICSANVQDLPSLEFSLSDIIDSIGDNCNSKSSEDSESLQQICDLESINSSNQQDSHENIDELKNNDNQMHHTKEDQDCLEMIKSLYR